MIQKYENGYAIAFADHRTLLSTKYGVYKVEGVVAGNEWAAAGGYRQRRRLWPPARPRWIT